jgi:hypothetical protein
MVRYEFSGGRDFQVAAAKLRNAGRDLPAETRQAVDKSARPLPLAAKRSAVLNLPRRGGLNLLVARSRFTIRRTSPTTVEVRARGIEQLENTNEGRVNHLTFGRRPWITQRIPRARDWFFKPMRKAKRDVKDELEDAMHRVAKKII